MSFDLAIRQGTVLTGSGWREGLDVGISGGRIAELGRGLRGAVEIDADGLHVVPGFVDVHVHGAGGSEEPREMAGFLPGMGVTAFVPTLASSAAAETLKFVQEVASLQPDAGKAEVLGSHLEGPWINRERRGAHAVENLRLPDLDEARQLLAASRGTLKRVTLAPEVPAAQALTGVLVKAAVQVSLGHSACSFQQALEAAAWGATSVTHVFNAMNPFHHREPGLAGAALTRDELLCELIADGVHVHPATALALVRARSAAKVAIVSDGLPPLGLPPGEYVWQGQSVMSDGSCCRLGDGALAGSASSMLQGVRNLVSWGVALEDACRMAAGSGAALAGVQSRKGTLAPGFDADVVLLDQDLELVGAYCRGVPASSQKSMRRMS